MIRYRDQIERELYGARQRLKASEHMVETTAKATTLAIHTRAAEAARRRIAALEAEHAAAPIRPRDNGGFRRQPTATISTSPTFCGGNRERHDRP